MKTTVRLWIIRATEKAYLFSRVPKERDPNSPGIWVPRSMVERITKFREVPGQWRECEAEIQEWFAEKKGLI